MGVGTKDTAGSEKRGGTVGNKRMILLAAGLALGLLLIAFGAFGEKTQSSEPINDAELMTEYALLLEEKATRLCEACRGVTPGTVMVTVTLERGYETVYAENEEDRMTSSGSELSGKYATVGSGSYEAPIKLASRAPVVAGIGVVCRGGGNAATRAELTALLSAAFGIGANKIYIAEGS